MGAQLEEAARDYAASDESTASSFERWEESMDEYGAAPPVSPGEAEAVAAATDRNSSGPQKASEDTEFSYDAPGWDHPEAPAPERER